MQIIKYIFLLVIFLSSSKIGKMLAQRYYYRVQELEELKNALNLFKTKIKFTYETIPEIFEEISNNITKNISNIFKSTVKGLEDFSISQAWEQAIESEKKNTNLNEEDIRVIKLLSKQLGITDIEGQISQIEITEHFLDTQIKQAQQEKEKNQKLYQKLGTTMGLVIVILLI